MTDSQIRLVEAYSKTTSRYKCLDVFRGRVLIGRVWQAAVIGSVEVMWTGGVLDPADRNDARKAGPIGWKKYLVMKGFLPEDGGRDAAVSFVCEKAPS